MWKAKIFKDCFKRQLMAISGLVCVQNSAELTRLPELARLSLRMGTKHRSNACRELSAAARKSAVVGGFSSAAPAPDTSGWAEASYIDKKKEHERQRNIGLVAGRCILRTHRLLAKPSGRMPYGLRARALDKKAEPTAKGNHNKPLGRTKN